MTPINKAEGIKLKGVVMVARKSDLTEISDDDICYTLVCKQVMYSLEDIVSSIPLVVTNLL